jgi:hypothetical protein
MTSAASRIRPRIRIFRRRAAGTLLSRIRFMVTFSLNLPDGSFVANCSAGNVSETWHITLVHGTFARNAAWTRPGSALREHLEAHLPGPVVYHRFRWSGWPSHLARDHAARGLRARLLKCVQNNETAHHCVIAHSHGGNIVCYALRDAAELVERLDCIITLSTPFLLVRRRNLSLFGLLSALGSLYVAIFGVFLLGISWALGPSTVDEFFDLARHMGVNGWWSYKSWIAWLIGVSVVVLVWGASLVLARWKAWLDATLAMPNLVGERLLIVRSFADEATALLVAAQFFEIVVTMFWGRSGALERALLSSGTWLGKRLVEWSQTPVGVALSRLVVAWAKLSFAGMVVLIPVAWYFYWTQPDAYVAFFLGPYTPTTRRVRALRGSDRGCVRGGRLLTSACARLRSHDRVRRYHRQHLPVAAHAGGRARTRPDGVRHGNLGRAGAGRGHLPRPADQAGAQDRHGRDTLSLDDLCGPCCARRHGGLRQAAVRRAGEPTPGSVTVDAGTIAATLVGGSDVRHCQTRA